MENDCRLRMGAFPVVYLLFFFLALFVFANETYTTLTKAATQLMVEVFQRNYRDSNSFWVLAIIALFVTAVAVHLLRLYISLELSDTDQDFYHEFLSDLNRWQRTLEFILRSLMILFVSLKALEKIDILKIDNMKDLAFFLLALYTILIIWDIFMFLTHRRLAWHYFIPSVTGLLGGGALLLFSRNPEIEASNIIAEMIILSLLSLVILGFVGHDLHRNGRHYRDHFNGKLSWIYGAKQCPGHKAKT